MVRVFLATVLAMIAWLGMVPLAASAHGLSLGTVPMLTLATTPVPAAEIKKFAKAYQSIQGIRDQAELDMAKAVEDAGLTVERFNAIADNEIANPGTPLKVANDSEGQQFDQAVGSIVTIRQTAEATMSTAIEKAGLSVDRFNEILDQSDQDADLYQRIGDQINGK